MEIQKEPLETYYDLFEDIGKGQFATVKRCIHKETQAEYAAKFIRKRRGGGRRGAKMEDIQKEIDILSSVSHRNIIRLFEVYETNREVILLLELVSGGELFEYLAEKDKLSEEEASAFVKQILDGLQHLHSKNIAHLDLKPENILLQDKNSTYVKLIDFGLSRIILPNEDHRAMMGTAEFVAPEVVSYDQLTLATDMWSIGVITYILLSGASPFLGDNQQETYHNITAVNYQFDEDYFNGTSEMAKGFIRSLLVKDKRKRATIHDCLKHPWIKPVEKKQRDLRRTSVIKTEHLKKFIARQRWKRSVRVVSLCNRLSRSIQLRRIQSTDTLGSCSEEIKVQLCLSVPAGSDDVSEGVLDGCSSDESPVGVAPLLDDIVASTIAKVIIDEVIQTVLRQLNENNDNSVEYLKNTTDQRNVEDIDDSSQAVVSDPNVNQVNDQVNLVKNVKKSDETVEVFVEQIEDVLLSSDFVKIENDECLKISSLMNWQLSRRKRKLSDLQDIKEENVNVVQDTSDKYGTPTNTESTQDMSKDDINLDLKLKDKETTYLTFSVQETDLLTAVNGAHENDNKSVVMSSSVLDDLIACVPLEQKGINTKCDHQSVDNISGEDKETKDNRVQNSKSNVTASFENPIRAENTFKDITLEQQVLDNLMRDIIMKSITIVSNSHIQEKVTERVANAELNTEESVLDATDNTDVNDYNDNLCDDGSYQENSHNQHFKTIEPHVTCSKLADADLTEQANSDDTDIKGLQKETTSSTLPNNEMISKFISSIIGKAKLELVDEENTASLNTEIRCVSDNVEVGVSQLENNTQRLSYYQLGLQDQLPRNECVGDITKQDSMEKSVYHYDPLRVVAFTVSWDLHTARDLFDIPEELDDGDEDGGELTESISDELRKKITRQRLRKMSLQRRVQAKFIQVTAFSEMTKFRKLRDEERIESFEMKVLSH